MNAGLEKNLVIKISQQAVGQLSGVYIYFFMNLQCLQNVSKSS
jgi:hypothetical protein